MKRNVRKESIVVNEREIKFMEFAQQCYKAQKRETDFSFYLTCNVKDLTKAWDIIKDSAAKGYIQHLKENKNVFTKIWAKIKRLFKK